MGSSSINQHDRITDDTVVSDKMGYAKGIQGLLDDMKTLLEQGTGDLNFNLKGGVKINCHSVIIKARCKKYKSEIVNCLDVNPEDFKMLLGYVYTGMLPQSKFQPAQLYKLYLLSLDFGVDDLTLTCEDLMLKNLDQSSALNILNEAVGTLSRNVKIQTIIDTCVTHLSENPPGIKNNLEFLKLPVETVVTLLRSEHLCLEEEEVWRITLSWAIFKAGVNSNLSVWTEDERVKVSVFLNPVISHVRLLLIDSRVFAEEVEPTGSVPMALSLERYRYAALSSNNGSAQVAEDYDPRLMPRNAQKLFHSSLIVNNERVALGKKLQEWYLQTPNSGGSSSSTTHWKCIYRGSLHGFSAEDFHRKVDGISPTFLVATVGNSKWICGGYTDIPWSSSKSPKYVTSSNSFLFSFCSSNGPVKFNVVKKHFAVCHDANSGPIFGAGADLYISSMCNSNNESYSNLPHSYEIDYVATANGGGSDGEQKKNLLLTPSYHFSVDDYEVFTCN